jgi:Secretion system C-terminal sorting domain
MKRGIISTWLILLVWQTDLKAQFSQNFESISCNRNNLLPPNNCWSFISFSTSSPLINGCSAQSSQLSNPALNQYILRTPGLQLSPASVISFNFRFNNNNSNPSFIITAVDIGTAVETTIYTRAAPMPTVTTAVSFSFPAAFGNYRLFFKPTGNGGTSRMFIDDINITNSIQIETYSTVDAACVIAALPLRLLDFRAQQKDDGNQLTWTVSEEKVLKYELEVSADGTDFNVVASVPARNLPSRYTYQYIDRQGDFRSNSFYRLKIIHDNQHATYSPVIRVAGSRTSSLTELSPNPVTGFFTVRSSRKIIMASVYSADGRKKFSLPLNAQQVFSVDASGLPTGVYILQLLEADGTVTTRKFIRE